eukprot:gene5112-biopygen10475
MCEALAFFFLVSDPWASASRWRAATARQVELASRWAGSALSRAQRSHRPSPTTAPAFHLLQQPARQLAPDQPAHDNDAVPREHRRGTRLPPVSRHVDPELGQGRQRGAAPLATTRVIAVAVAVAAAVAAAAGHGLVAHEQPVNLRARAAGQQLGGACVRAPRLAHSAAPLQRLAEAQPRVAAARRRGDGALEREDGAARPAAR